MGAMGGGTRRAPDGSIREGKLRLEESLVASPKGKTTSPPGVAMLKRFF